MLRYFLCVLIIGFECGVGSRDFVLKVIVHDFHWAVGHVHAARSYRTVDSSLRLWCRCRVMTFRDWYVYGSDVSGWCCAEFWRVKFVACTDMMCRDDAVSISDFLSFLGVRFSCIELMPYTVWTWWIWCVYGLNLSGRCCVELAVYDRMCRVKTV